MGVVATVLGGHAPVPVVSNGGVTTVLDDLPRAEGEDRADADKRDCEPQAKAGDRHPKGCAVSGLVH